ncbi:parkin co-regulated protein-domain-containing protein [Baffinella frigidus]|nr:parkin co-regulated protein-domain-containing protein [Cryptophyta sp. CCMP2293]
MNIPMHTKYEPRTVPAAVRRGDPPPGARAAAAPASRPGGAPRGDAARPAVSGWAASPATGRNVGSSAVRAAPGAAAPAKPPSRGNTWNELPSSRLKSVKCADPFATKSSQFKTNFANVYNAGGIPVRLNHGAVNITLKWGKEPSSLDYDPLLVTCAEGLVETVHPYAFAARACFTDLLRAEGGGEKAMPLVARIVPSITNHYCVSLKWRTGD